MFSIRFIAATIVAIAFCAVEANAQDDKSKNKKIKLTKAERALLKDYRGNVVLPDSLLRAYAKFAAATQSKTEIDLSGFILPHSVPITTTPRQKKQLEYGIGMNIPFLKTRFQKQILNLAKYSKDCYLIRTGSSYMRYVKTASNQWKIYHYGDKPIE